ncbi:MAG: hypothetical protein KC419_16630 [Anaerolineales bacterium]|nr:hypothetical protein [Anaerolineales bacterium]MCA9930112.1 hypothetical protein [Anaerolineales bacterium]
MENREDRNGPALTAVQKDQIRNTRLSNIIKRNTNMTDIQDDLFAAQ